MVKNVKFSSKISSVKRLVLERKKKNRSPNRGTLKFHKKRKGSVLASGDHFIIFGDHSINRIPTMYLIDKLRLNDKFTY